MKEILFIPTIVISLFALTCKKEPPLVVPDHPTHPIFAWTIDTIRNPYPDSQLLLGSIWGTSESNVYSCGFNGVGAATLWHFDGTVWKEVKINASEGGLIQGAIYLTAIRGFNANDIWAVGDKGIQSSSPPYRADSSAIIHFNGSNWTEIQITRGAVLNNVTCVPPVEVYAVSAKGEVFEYDGTEWRRHQIDSSASLFSVGGDSQRQFIGGYHYMFPNSYYDIYSRDVDGNWVEKDKISEVDNQISPKFGFNFYPLGGSRYFASGYGIFLLTDTVWTREYQDGYYYSAMNGTAGDNIYAVGPVKRAIHWNGNDWATLGIPDNLDNTLSFTGVWATQTEVFICAGGSQFDMSVILHGKKQN